MFDFLNPLAAPPGESLLNVLMHLVAAWALGLLISAIYKRSIKSPEGPSPSLASTLVLLTILICIVTQVIGQNVARAFSLVGALSIVRFRTVVRDTRDTAFVMFAVIIGMAIGSANLSVALVGVLLTGAAALLLARGQTNGMADDVAPLVVVIRVALGLDLEKTLGASLNAYLGSRRLMSVSTAKQGVSLQVVYEAELRPDASAVELVSALNQVEGVQDVRIQRKGFEAE